MTHIDTIEFDVAALQDLPAEFDITGDANHAELRPCSWTCLFTCLITGVADAAA
jgi:hypothetical protein